MLIKCALHNAPFPPASLANASLWWTASLYPSPSPHTAAAVCVVFAIHTAWWQPVGGEDAVFYLSRVKHSLNPILNK